MKLCAVFPVHNQLMLSEAVLDVAKANLSGKHDVEFLVLDNASEHPFIPNLQPYEKAGSFTLKGVRLAANIGVYPIFWEALKHTDADVIAYFHSDVFIAEEGWDERVLHAFELNQNLGMLGFIGSNEIDGSGGRGLGTASNFQGNEYTHSTHGGEAKTWKGSAAEIHGRRETSYMNAAVVDGCVMIFQRKVLEEIPERSDFPPHHFYDRLLSCEVREHGYQVGVLGVGFDHIGGQTVNQESSYSDMAKQWVRAHLGIQEFSEYKTPAGNPAHNWDTVLYLEAERRWLSEYRDNKHLVPCRV